MSDLIQRDEYNLLPLSTVGFFQMCHTPGININVNEVSLKVEKKLGDQFISGTIAIYCQFFRLNFLLLS